MRTDWDVANIIKAQGGRLYHVGGSVRDKYAHIEATDQDYCVTGLAQDHWLRLFPEAKQVGRIFPVYLLPMDGTLREVALARTEKKVTCGHTGFSVDVASSITIEQDLLRRDLTINAMAIDVLTGTWIDPFEGRQDWDQKLIRATSAAFLEDPLRVYRTARFAAVFSFRIEEDTVHLMNSLHSELANLAVERVWEETVKALRANRPSIYFRCLADAHVLDAHFPELAALQGVPQPALYHPEGDAFTHTMQVLDAARRLTDRVEVLWAALCHDLGKAVTQKEHWPHHHGHEGLGIPLVHTLSERLKVPRNTRKAALFATEQHMRLHLLNRMRTTKVLDLLQAAARNPLGVQGLIWVGMADLRGRDNPDAACESLENVLPQWQRLLQEVRGTGFDLYGASAPRKDQGAQFGNVLRQARIAWWDRNIKGK